MEGMSTIWDGRRDLSVIGKQGLDFERAKPGQIGENERLETLRFTCADIDFHYLVPLFSINKNLNRELAYIRL